MCIFAAMRIYISRKIIFLTIFVIVFLIYALFFFGFKSTSANKHEADIKELTKRIASASKNLDENESILQKLQQHFDELSREAHHVTRLRSHSNEEHNQALNHQSNHHSNVTIPVVVFAYNRPTVSRCLDLLFKYRNVVGVNFPVVVSRDGDHAETAKVIDSYGSKLTHLHHPAEKIDINPKNHRFLGYYKISAHYKWALSKAFEHFPAANAIIIVEDDLEIAPDFFKYFFAAYHLLMRDSTLYCVSGWNDNGKQELIDKQATTLLYRSDFFPGLGWMITRETWSEFGVKWPIAFWDDWVREPDQRQGRSCIRPEISRTKTFGRVGVSNGQFFDKYLKYIKLNDVDVNWQHENLKYLDKENYDEEFVLNVLDLPELTMSDLKSLSTKAKKVKVTYTNAASFKILAKLLGIMDDFKAGVPRTAYRGIVSIFFKNVRVYLTPSQPWLGYDVKWT